MPEGSFSTWKQRYVRWRRKRRCAECVIFEALCRKYELDPGEVLTDPEIFEALKENLWTYSPDTHRWEGHERTWTWFFRKYIHELRGSLRRFRSGLPLVVTIPRKKGGYHLEVIIPPPPPYRRTTTAMNRKRALRNNNSAPPVERGLRIRRRSTRP